MEEKKKKKKNKINSYREIILSCYIFQMLELTWAISYRSNPYPRNPPISLPRFNQFEARTFPFPKDPRSPNISIKATIRANRESHIRLRVITRVPCPSFKESLVRDRSYDRWDTFPLPPRFSAKNKKKSENLEPYWDPCQLRYGS